MSLCHSHSVDNTFVAAITFQYSGILKPATFINVWSYSRFGQFITCGGGGLPLSRTPSAMRKVISCSYREWTTRPAEQKWENKTPK